MIDRDVVRQVVSGVCEGVLLSVVVWCGMLAGYWLFIA